MFSLKQGEEAIMPSLNQMVEREEGEDVKEEKSRFSFKNFLWHGGSAYDAWFSCASNQVIELFLGYMDMVSFEHKKFEKARFDSFLCFLFLCRLLRFC